MKVLVTIYCLGALACGGRNVGPAEKASTTTTPSETTAPSTLSSVRIMNLEFEGLPSDPVTTQVSLVETDETGANNRHDLGVFDGECKDVTPDVRVSDPQVFLAFHCQPFANQRGVLVHIMARQSQLILLRAWLGATKPTFDEFDQIGELPPFPTGVPIKTEYDK